MTHIASAPRRSALLAIPLAFAATLAVLRSAAARRAAPGARRLARRPAAPRRRHRRADRPPAVGGPRGRRRPVGRARRRVPAEGARDRRRELLRARRRRAPRRCARPNDADAVVQAATLAARAPRLPRALSLVAARPRAAPDALAAFPVQVDAQVELGRYDDAERVLQRLGRPQAEPRRLRARVVPARAARRPRRRRRRRCGAAIAAGGPAPENVAYVQTLLGELELARGRRRRARRAYAPALAARPRLRARARRAARGWPRRGRLARDRAAGARSSSGCRCPSTRSALGEAELAAGRVAAGAARPRARRRRGAAARRRGREHRRRARGLRGRPRLAGRAASSSRGGPGRRRRACARPTRSAGR